MPDANNVTDKQVDRARQDVEKLREKIEAAKVDLSVSEASRQNAVQIAVFDAEKDRLQAELDALNEALKASKTSVAEDQVVKQVQGEPVGVISDTAVAPTGGTPDSDTKEK